MERTGACVVCGQMEAMLDERLRRDQFRLATREADQARHAKDGGFCPLHTWQYAAMASPLGISAGFARLAVSVADALEFITDRSGTGQELSQGVTGLAQDRECPVCRALADCETGAVTSIAAQPPAASADTLCLRHLGLVLAAHPAPERGLAMIRALALVPARPRADTAGRLRHPSRDGRPGEITNAA